MDTDEAGLRVALDKGPHRFSGCTKGIFACDTADKLPGTKYPIKLTIKLSWGQQSDPTVSPLSSPLSEKPNPKIIKLELLANSDANMYRYDGSFLQPQIFIYCLRGNLRLCPMKLKITLKWLISDPHFSSLTLPTITNHPKWVGSNVTFRGYFRLEFQPTQQ